MLCAFARITGTSMATKKHSQPTIGNVITAKAPWAGRSIPHKLAVACVFWLLCLTLSAAGHRLYKFVVSVDREVSAELYRNNGAPLLWVGHGYVEHALEKMSSESPHMAVAQLYALPVSTFWLSSAICFLVLGSVLVLAARWVSCADSVRSDFSRIQSLPRF